MFHPALMFISLSLASLGLAFVSQLIYKKFTDQEALNEIKKKTEKLKKKMEGSGMEEKTNIQSEMMDLSMKRMKLTMKPMLFSSALFLGIFPVLRHFYSGFISVEFPFSLPLIKDDIGWFLTYLIFSLIGNTVFKKLLIDTNGD